MKVDGQHFRSIWLADDGWSVEIIDQRALPHAFVIERLASLDEVVVAIRGMHVRGAPLIGATAAYGVCLGLREGKGLEEVCAALLATRPTAVNLRWALDRMRGADDPYACAASICDDDVRCNEAIGEHGARVESIERRSGETLNVLTHCNAGWLATVDWGTALAPVFKAYDAGVPVHVWVDETRPRNQGSSLTAWELVQHGVPHTVICDNSGGHLMQRGLVDVVITGTDRTTRTGDVCNKIGTYLKALAANDNDVPFYIGLPGSTIDWTLTDGMDIPIEQRDGREVSHIRGREARYA